MTNICLHPYYDIIYFIYNFISEFVHIFPSTTTFTPSTAPFRAPAPTFNSFDNYGQPPPIPSFYQPKPVYNGNTYVPFPIYNADTNGWGWANSGSAAGTQPTPKGQYLNGNSAPQYPSGTKPACSTCSSPSNASPYGSQSSYVTATSDGSSTSTIPLLITSLVVAIISAIVMTV
jgi:hypothetical protein